MCRPLLCMGIIILIASVGWARSSTSPSAAAEEGRISGRLINDVDADADPNDTEEPGLVGWRMVLVRDAQEGEKPLNREVKTGHDGGYEFADLPPGNYTVSIPCDGQPNLWIGTWPNSDGSYGASVTEDSPDNDYLNFFVRMLGKEPAQNGSIHGKLVWDKNRDGVADPTEPAVAGWQVDGGDISLGCFTLPYQVRYTADDGSFSFDGLIAGQYSLSTIGPSGVPHPDYLLDAPGSAVPTEGGYDTFWFQPIVDVPEGGTGDITIGILDMSGESTISGSIYVDANGNGVHDAGEGLLDCDCWMGLMYRTPKGYAPVTSRITSAASHGEYVFSGLASGDYLVVVLQPPGIPTDPGAGPNSFPYRLISVPDRGTVSHVDFGIAPGPDSSLPTVAPTQAADAGTPVPPGGVASPASSGVSAPSTGSGGTASTDRTPWTAAAIGLAVIGSAGYTLSRLRRRA